MDRAGLTQTGHTGVLRTDATGRLVVRRVLVRVVKGPDAGLERLLEGGSLFVGSSATADVVLTDRAVSRQHAELSLLERGVRVCDLDSKNGTFFGGSRVEAMVVPVPAEIRVGETRLELLASDQPLPEAPSEHTRFGSLVGASPAMRRLFGVLERVAPTDAAVLVEGEEGTGKSEVAQAIHRASRRAARTLVVLDVAAPGALDAVADHVAAASGGTLVLDRLDLASRPMAEALVRWLDGRERGELDLRVISTSRADLRARVEEGRFPRDLYFLVAAVRVTVPPLRERAEDVPLLVACFAESLGWRDAKLSETDLGPTSGSQFPGNLRELRQLVEGALSRRAPPRPPPAHHAVTPRELGAQLSDLPYKDAKEQVVDAFTRRYLEQLLERHDGNVSRAAEEAGLGRNHLTRLLQKHGLR